MTTDPIDLFFGGMDKLGPGDDASTEHVLGLVPRASFGLVVDAGCGTGRQSITLARRLRTPVHALDAHPGFLETLSRKADAAGVGHLVHPRHLDMAEIPAVFDGVDLLWSEAAAYSIGLERALNLWARALSPDGYLVLSELCWARDAVSSEARAFFDATYPQMRSVTAVQDLAVGAGYRVLATHTVPKSAWWHGYYEVLEPRASGLRAHPDPAVRALAEEMLVEIDVFRRFSDEYGYVFFVLDGARLPGQPRA